MGSNSTNKHTLLAVLAHPDDESFGMGGTLALYARKGVDVHLVCATRGEAGEVDPAYLENFGSIAERREYELRCAANKLELTSVHFLDYRDSGMPGSAENQHPQALINAPLEDVAAKVAGYIRQLQSQVVLTFDSIGGYKHPDHIAVHHATVKAFQLAGDPDFKDAYPPYRPLKLYFHVFPKGFLRFAIWLLRLFRQDPQRFGRNQDIDLTSLVGDGDFPIHAKIDYSSVRDIKEAASLCHASQLDGASQRRGPIRWVTYLISRQDNFLRAEPPPTPGLCEQDLFADI